MRIGMMADLYKPHISGVTNYIDSNKRYLEKQGIEVFVFTFGSEDQQDDEVNVIRSPGMHVLDTGFYIGLRYNKNARQILRTMDLVHVHHPFLSGQLALRYCRQGGIPIIFTNHTRYDLYAQAYLPGVPDVVGITALQAYLPNFCRSCDLVIAPSPGMRDVLKGFGVDAPIEVVPNGVDLDRFHEAVEPAERSKWGIKPDDVVLVYVGRLGPEKNLPFLLRSFAGTSQAYENVHLMVVGSGPEQDNLIDRVRHMGISERVHFAGLVPYDDIPCYLEMADVFVTASITEVHPLSVIEAMAAGLPVLGITSPGVGDTIQDGKTGYLVSDVDLASFTAKMVRLVVDQESRQIMGEQARQTSEIFHIANTSRIMFDIYQKIIQQAADRKRGLRYRLTRWLNSFRS